MEDVFYTVKEIAENLKVTEITVRRWIESDKLKAIKVQGVVRVSKDDYLKFLKAG